MGYIVEETAKVKSFGSLRGTSVCSSVGTLALTERQEEKLQVGENVN